VNFFALASLSKSLLATDISKFEASLNTLSTVVSDGSIFRAIVLI